MAKEKKKTKKKKSLTKLLQRTLFISHDEKEVDPDAELSCYLTDEDAVQDPCCEFVTEVLVVRTTTRGDVVQELRKRGVKIAPKLKEDRMPITSQQVIYLLKLVKQSDTKIGDLIGSHLGKRIPMKMLTFTEAEYIIKESAEKTAETKQGG